MKKQENNIYGITAKELRRAQAIANRLVTPIVTYRNVSLGDLANNRNLRSKLRVVK